ncbi:MAG TPA: putative quinol monooxygenase [Lacipirellula sp.]
MIHVIATIEVAEGKRGAFIEEFRRIIKLVRDEDGCIEYGPAIDIATDVSAEPRPNIVTVIEKWANVEALEAHLKAPHMARYREMVRDIVTGIHIQVLQPA